MITQEAAIWVYGSFAKGHEDEYSDLDILIVCDYPLILSIDDVPFSISADKLSLSNYTWLEIEKMASYGSLFLHHLNLEAKPIFESERVKGRLAKTLKHLSPYQRVRSDIESFFSVLADVEESISKGCSLIYELCVLGTILRHSCILGCYISGFSTFGRVEPVEIFIKKFNLNKTTSTEFNQLYNYRLYSQRSNCEVKEVETEYAILWCERISFVLRKIKELAHDYERKMLATNFSR